jgi:hypothetical protein
MKRIDGIDEREIKLMEKRREEREVREGRGETAEGATSIQGEPRIYIARRPRSSAHHRQEGNATCDELSVRLLACDGTRYTPQVLALRDSSIKWGADLG